MIDKKAKNKETGREIDKMKKRMMTAVIIAASFLMISCSHKASEPAGNLGNAANLTQAAQITAAPDINDAAGNHEQTTASSSANNETTDPTGDSNAAVQATVTPPPGMTEQNPEIDEAVLNKNTNYVPGFNVIKDQSFWTEFENWGKVFFIAAGGEGEFGLNSLYLYLADKDCNILYEFPYFYGNGMQLDSVKAVAFEDVNQDGLNDIIVIADYMTGIGPSGAEAFPLAGVYFQKGKEFINLPEVDDEINSSGENTSTDQVLNHLKGMDIQLN